MRSVLCSEESHHLRTHIAHPLHQRHTQTSLLALVTEHHWRQLTVVTSQHQSPSSDQHREQVTVKTEASLVNMNHGEVTSLHQPQYPPPHGSLKRADHHPLLQLPVLLPDL